MGLSRGIYDNLEILRSLNISKI